jgi:hypothetical protein
MGVFFVAIFMLMYVHTIKFVLFNYFNSSFIVRGYAGYQNSTQFQEPASVPFYDSR